MHQWLLSEYRHTSANSESALEDEQFPDVQLMYLLSAVPASYPLMMA